MKAKNEKRVAGEVRERDSGVELRESEGVSGHTKHSLHRKFLRF